MGAPYQLPVDEDNVDPVRAVPVTIGAVEIEGAAGIEKRTMTIPDPPPPPGPLFAPPPPLPVLATPFVACGLLLVPEPFPPIELPPTA